MNTTLKHINGRICVAIPATIFGKGTPIDASANYEAVVNNAAVTVTLKVGNYRKLVTFGGALDMGGTKAAPRIGLFGLDIDPEAKALGWTAGRAVTVTTHSGTYSLTIV